MAVPSSNATAKTLAIAATMTKTKIVRRPVSWRLAVFATSLGLELTMVIQIITIELRQ